MIKVGDVLMVVGLDTSKLDQQMKNLGTRLTSMGKKMTLGITAPLAIFGGLAIKTAADFDRSMAKVNAVTGATAAEVLCTDCCSLAIAASQSVSCPMQFR